jgi:hypothetical protein
VYSALLDGLDRASQRSETMCILFCEQGSSREDRQ